MKDFNNHSDTNRKLDRLNNQTFDRYSGYNNNNNNNSSSNSVFKNICNNSVYDDNDYNRSSKNFEEFYKRQKKENVKNILLFIVLGLIFLGAFIASCFFVNAENFNVSDIVPKNAEKIFALLISGVFGLVGLAILLYPIINKRKKMKSCKYLVKATIIDFKRSYHSEGGTSYYPVYEFCYNGETYTVTNSMSVLFSNPDIGTKVDIFINEDDPYDFYAEIKSTELFFICFGLTFIWGMFNCIFSILLG